MDKLISKPQVIEDELLIPSQYLFLYVLIEMEKNSLDINNLMPHSQN